MPNEEKTLDDIREEQKRKENKEITLEDIRKKKKYELSKDKRVQIWDTSGIINSNELPKGLTVPDVLWEVKDVNKFRTFSLKTEEPSDGSVRKIEKVATQLKERVSDADIKVIALALEKENSIIRTDDNGIQNIASYLDIPFKGNFFNIETERTWSFYCNACKKWREEKICDNCGNPTVRKPKKFKKV